MTGHPTFDSYCLGWFNNQGVTLFMFRYCRADGTFSGCQAVAEVDIPAHIAHLQRLGFVRRAAPVLRVIEGGEAA